MMNPGLGTSLTRAGTALQVIATLLLLTVFMVVSKALMTGAGPGVVMNIIWFGIGLPAPLWFLGLCGKVLADIHGYCYWSQENAMARDARPVATI